MSTRNVCPVVHTGLNWAVIALLLVLIATSVVGLFIEARRARVRGVVVHQHFETSTESEWEPW